MWPFNRNKFNKLKRDEVVSAMLALQKQEQVIEEGLVSKQQEIDALTEKGRREPNHEIKLFYAKKINALKAERQNNVQRGMYLMYNIGLLGKLKDAIDDKNFIASVGDVPLNKLLTDQKGLAKYLNKALGNRIKSEEIMTGADEVFANAEASYYVNQDIYGVNKHDDELLAMFETEAALSDELSLDRMNIFNKNTEEIR